MLGGEQLTAFHYDVVIMAVDQQQADRVMVERVRFDEDLSEYGVNNSHEVTAIIIKAVAVVKASLFFIFPYSSVHRGHTASFTGFVPFRRSVRL